LFILLLACTLSKKTLKDLPLSEGKPFSSIHSYQTLIFSSAEGKASINCSFVIT
jgi:hypothetical protein